MIYSWYFSNGGSVCDFQPARRSTVRYQSDWQGSKIGLLREPVAPENPHIKFCANERSGTHKKVCFGGRDRV
jgi:hypothetical protein